MLYETTQFHTFFEGLEEWQKPLVFPQIEAQTFRPGKRAGCRIPSEKPFYAHDVADYGASGLDMECQCTRYATAEQDIGHSSNPITVETRDQIEALIHDVQPPGLIYSSSGGGKGRHFRIFLTDPLPAQGVTYTERRHNNRVNAMRVLTYLDDEYLHCQKRLGYSLASTIEAKGCILNFAKRSEEGQRLIYRSEETLNVPRDYPLSPDFPQAKGTKVWDKSKPLQVEQYPLWVCRLLDRLQDHCEVVTCPTSGFISLHLGGLAALWRDWQFQTAEFVTDSAFTDPSTPQAWGLVTEDGQLMVGPYGDTVESGPIWNQSERGGCYTFVGRLPSLPTVAAMIEGKKTPKGFVFKGEQRLSTLKTYGLEPELAEDDEPLIAISKEDGVLFRQPGKRKNGRSVNYGGEMKGEWLFERGSWEQFVESDVAEQDASLDDKMRRSKILYIIDENEADGVWIRDNKASQCAGIKAWIKHRGETTCNMVQSEFKVDAGVARSIIQDVESDFVYRENKPLMPVFLPPNGRFPRDRINVSPVQFVALPKQGQTPFFDLNCARWGEFLTPYVEDSPGCKQLGIASGAQYMRHLFLEMFHPVEERRQLPIVQFFGPHNGGKSSYHKAASAFLRHGDGVVNLRHILKAKDNGGTEFNSELVGSILAYSDERDNSHDNIRDRLKEMATSERLDSRRMRTDVRKVDATFSLFLAYNNLCHGVHEVGDRRSIITYIDSLDKDQIVPPHKFRSLLRSEASAFIHEALNYQPLDSHFSLVLPVLFTGFKAAGWEALTADMKPVKGRAMELHNLYLLAQHIDANYAKPFRPVDLKGELGERYSCFNLSSRTINEVLQAVVKCGTGEPTLDKRPTDASYVAGSSDDYGIDWFLRRGLRFTFEQDRSKSNVYTLHRVERNPRKED
ncbi:MAG: hypothetical protein GX617_14295 [Lentisphaerae bacterium]|nr:hypothetical protein [Lentisphaerota bacterium]